MKKVFFSLMLVASLAFAFTSCNKDKNESETHLQVFTLGGSSYSIDNAIAIENIQYEGSEIYNAIVLYTGSLTGEAGVEGQGVVILFRGNINAGTYNLSENENYYPKYIFADLSVTDIVNFDITQLADDNAYVATSGTLNVAIADGKHTITTSGIEVKNAVNNSVESSSVDFEGVLAVYRLATVEEGTLDDGENTANVVTAGTTKYPLGLFDLNIAGFITDAGDLIGFTSTQSFTDGVPVGEYTNSDYPMILVNEMDFDHLKYATGGSISVAKEGDVYTINITDATIDGKTYNMHYVGTLPFFELPL